jgi:hypothetical protein
LAREEKCIQGGKHKGNRSLVRPRWEDNIKLNFK